MSITLNGTTGITTPALDSQGVAVVNRQTTDGTIIDLRKDGTTVGSIGVGSANDLYIGRADTGLLFDNSDYIRPWNTGTNAARDAAIDLGVSDSRFKDLYLSGGVYLGGTGAANKLDDYEEGTFDPRIDGWTGTYGTQGGVYTKIGNWVHCYGGIITNSGTGSFSGTFPGLAGLPFTGGISISGAMGYVHIISGSTGIPSSKTSMLPLDGPPSGSSSAFPNWVGVGGDSSNFTNVYLDASSNVGYRFTISYRTS